jgi:hypothetical protein
VFQAKLAAAGPAYLSQACVYTAANVDQLSMQVVLDYLSLLLKGCGLTLQDMQDRNYQLRL